MSQPTADPRDAGRLTVGAVSGPELSPAEAGALVELRPAGVVLFARNLRSPGQTADLVAGLREAAGAPLFVAVDQEGGRVNRLREIEPLFLRLPPGRVQAGWDAGRLRAVWAAVGQALGALGFDVDFHPIVDLDDGPGLNAIGDRSFGTRPEHVTSVGEAVLCGLEEAGIAGCLKHFPGLGGSDLDTHLALATSPLTADALWDEHLLPYRELSARAPLVMTAHAHYPAVDGPAPLPASFSPTLVAGWLRGRLGFDGLVVSDDLEMGAVTSSGTGPAERACRALEAGCDLAMFCHGLDAPRRARDEIARRIERGELPPARLADALRRLDALLARYPGGRARATGARPFAAACAALASLI
ncbi:MAG: beta-N-acetylhexosaminidase [Acidobacteria bacterium]|nr:beta-N-acetylhexosaminidase [Acidobacteriota bacterium]